MDLMNLKQQIQVKDKIIDGTVRQIEDIRKQSKLISKDNLVLTEKLKTELKDKEGILKENLELKNDNEEMKREIVKISEN